jgi:hypothetical protein
LEDLVDFVEGADEQQTSSRGERVRLQRLHQASKEYQLCSSVQFSPPSKPSPRATIQGMAPPPPALPEELVEAILLRFPPDEPACLFRASLVCKPWCRLISGPGFRRRYRKFHRSPPLLGFLCGVLGSDIETARFVPTSAFCSPLADLRQCRAIDAHRGRVLLRCPGKASENVLVVWDPISDERRELPMPTRLWHRCRWDWNAAVLCAADCPSWTLRHRLCGHPLPL